MARDLTEKQFEAACKRQDFGLRNVLGYRDIGVDSVYVCAVNAGPNRRAQLAYLIRERDRWLAKHS